MNDIEMLRHMERTGILEIAIKIMEETKCSPDEAIILALVHADDLCKKAIQARGHMRAVSDRVYNKINDGGNK